MATLDVHTTRIQRQRQIKQQQNLFPVVPMSKDEVEGRKLTADVLNEDETLTFGAWGKTLEDDDIVEVQYPHELGIHFVHQL